MAGLLLSRSGRSDRAATLQVSPENILRPLAPHSGYDPIGAPPPDGGRDEVAGGLEQLVPCSSWLRGPAITEIDSPLLRGGRYLIDAPVSSRSTTVPLTSSNGNRAGSETGNFVRMRDSDHVSQKKLMPSGVRGVLTIR